MICLVYPKEFFCQDDLRETFCCWPLELYMKPGKHPS